MLYMRTVIPSFDIGKSMRSTEVANQHGVTLGEITGILGFRRNMHQPR